MITCVCCFAIKWQELRHWSPDYHWWLRPYGLLKTSDGDPGDPSGWFKVERLFYQNNDWSKLLKFFLNRNRVFFFNECRFLSFLLSGYHFCPLKQVNTQKFSCVNIKNLWVDSTNFIRGFQPRMKFVKSTHIRKFPRNIIILTNSNVYWTNDIGKKKLLDKSCLPFHSYFL